MYMKTTLASSAIVLALAISACSPSDELATAPSAVEAADLPSFSARHNLTLTANVEAINHATREVTLTDPNGNQVTFNASEEVRNLGQVNTGDSVNIDYVQSVNVQLVAENGIDPVAEGVVIAGVAEEGEMPGMEAISESIIVSTVEEINIEANTFKLKDSEGNVQEYIAQNPENLKKATVGDSVVISIVEAIAMSVNQAAAAAEE